MSTTRPLTPGGGAGGRGAKYLLGKARYTPWGKYMVVFKAISCIIISLSTMM